MSCEQIGNFEKSDEPFVDLVLKVDPEGTCQSHQVCALSPGPVENDEPLARFVFAPAHLNESGRLDETLVLDAFKRGASVNRQSAHDASLHTAGEEQAEAVRQGGQGRAAQPERAYLGFLLATAGAIRRLAVDDCATRFRIYDTALPTNPRHADIVCDARNLAKTLKKQMRVLLFLELRKGGLHVSPAQLATVDATSLGCEVHRSAGNPH